MEANYYGNNIQWLFVVVFQGVCCFIFRCFLEDIGVVGRGEERVGGGGCFYKVVGHRVFSCIQVVLVCWCFLGNILLFRRGSSSGHFLVAISHFYLSLYLYSYPLLFSLCVHVQGFNNCHIRTLLQCPVLFSLIWLIYCYRLTYLELFNYRSH